MDKKEYLNKFFELMDKQISHNESINPIYFEYMGERALGIDKDNIYRKNIHFREDNVPRYVKDLCKAIKGYTKNPSKAKEKWLQFNKRRLDSIRGTQGWDVYVKKEHSLPGSQDKDMWYWDSEDTRYNLISREPKVFVKCVLFEFEKLHPSLSPSARERIEEIISEAAEWYFLRLSNEKLMSHSRILNKPNEERNEDDYEDI